MYAFDSRASEVRIKMDRGFAFVQYRLGVGDRSGVTFSFGRNPKSSTDIDCFHSKVLALKLISAGTIVWGASDNSLIHERTRSPCVYEVPGVFNGGEYRICRGPLIDAPHGVLTRSVFSGRGESRGI